MNRAMRIANNRGSQIVAFGGALLTAAQAFGVPITAEQMSALAGVLLLGVGLLAGRNITQAARRPPEE